MGSLAAAAPALAAAVLFGASTPFAKWLLGGIVPPLDPWLLAGLLYLGSGLGLALLNALRPARAEAPIARADLPWLTAVVLLGGALGPLLLMLGLRDTPAATASLLLNAEGIATMLIAWLVFHENADRRILLGAGAIIAGAAILSWQAGTAADGGWGTLLILGACLAWGIDNNLSRRLSAADPVRIAMIKGLVAGAVNLALALARGAHWPRPGALLEAGLLGFLGYGASLVLFMRALRALGAARTGAYFSLAPFIGAIIAVSLFGEPLTARLILAAALMGLGLYLHLAERHDHEHAHETMQHDHGHVHDAHHDHGHDHGPDAPPGEPHSHPHTHQPMVHRHRHYPDLHHRHRHHGTAQTEPD